ncbi:MAG: glycosyltransferase family 39 protein [Pyrinomonadaceae bacterium]
MAQKSNKTFAQLRSEILNDEPFEKPLEKSPEKSAPTVSFFDSPLFWRVGTALVLIVAVALRFYDLSLKPFHHDEGVNGFFLKTLFKSGIYHYDPQNYHGPTLYFFALVSSYLFGLNDFGVRLVPALFGVLCVVGIFSLRRYLGSVGALTAGMLIAFSPGMVFISRYFIHEMLFVFFTFSVPLCIVKFIERSKVGSIAASAMAILLMVCLFPGTLNFASIVGGANVEIRNVAIIGFLVLEAGIVFLLMRFLLGWEVGRPIYLLLVAASAALIFATKETAFISLGTMLIAVVCISVWLMIWQPDKETMWCEPVELSFRNFRASFTESNSAVLTMILCAAIFAYVAALFFSSFFTYPGGVYGAFEAYVFWTKTGSKDHTQNSPFAYLKWLWAMEAFLLILGALGALIAFAKAKHRFAMFAALWAWGLIAAYSIIPYKTPWLSVNFILPLGLIAGYGINELATSRETWQRSAAAFLAAGAFGWAAYQSIDLNFYKYDDDSKPYVYAHTRRQFLDLVKDIERTAEISGKSKDASILIVSPDYWPLPWYLRDYQGAAFFGQISKSETAEIIIGSVTQAAELDKEYASHYDFIGTYTMRPGVDLMLYVRRDLTDKVTVK